MPAAFAIAVFWLVQASAVTVVLVPFEWSYAGLWAGSHFLRALGLTIIFHRYLAHRAFQLSRGARFFWALLGTAGSSQTMKPKRRVPSASMYSDTSPPQ